jgi:hypothetical protein
MGAELASDHAAYLRGRIGREPNGGDLYAAHFLGPANAARLIEAAARTPAAKAAALFPAAAGANRSIFYEKGRAATVAEVYADLTRVRAEAAASAPKLRPAQVATAPEPEAVTAAVRVTTSRPDPLRAALARADRARRESLLIDMVLGGGGPGGLNAPAFSAELLSLLSEARRR